MNVTIGHTKDGVSVEDQVSAMHIIVNNALLYSGKRCMCVMCSPSNVSFIAVLEIEIIERFFNLIYFFLFREMDSQRLLIWGVLKQVCSMNEKSTVSKRGSATSQITLVQNSKNGMKQMKGAVV